MTQRPKLEDISSMYATMNAQGSPVRTDDENNQRRREAWIAAGEKDQKIFRRIALGIGVLTVSGLVILGNRGSDRPIGDVNTEFAAAQRASASKIVADPYITPETAQRFSEIAREDSSSDQP